MSAQTLITSLICLQEVDRFDDLADLLREDGYVGVYKGRTGEARDGGAVFWKEKEFSLLHQENIEYQSFGLRDNVAQLCVLKVCHNQSNISTCEDADSSEPMPSQTVVVGNIHVLFNPKRGDIKLGQIRLLLERMHAVSLQWGNAPVVICGDFNSVPQSALYQYLSAPELDILLYDRRKISGQDEFPLQKRHFSVGRNASRSRFCMQKLLQFKWSEEEIHLAVGNGGCTHLKNPLKLFSAYRGVPIVLSMFFPPVKQSCSNSRDNCGEPLVTSYHSKFMGTVDYIWHSAGIVPVAVVETLPIKNLKKLGGLPSEKWGSDHLALVCEFAFVDDGSAS
ncbi:carbon catabolite repressor protein 4 homolog 5 isoform X2 [Asparagus officinalis]|uniref:carbon catabolite repressor protein 4 homolog 5 isoform X2 n=1 Tax=Asparagus officinalis TaxID=4686 RepID=UPI00098DF956|nr:carbon catabolite repressor protein 4 homolog 5 isoform X2 [Asparagus officinalis]XP_020251875.1 carbon catabolite repressor protein 4 homolog 5 isoform X2 [Asparagus officinalis]